KLDPVRIEFGAVAAISGLFNVLFWVYPGLLVAAAAAAAKSLF
ncbi:MAG: NADH-quinone oxidoreductase subunit, partial [Bradyrhizobium sp.]